MGKQTCQVDASCKTFDETLQGKGAFCWDVKKELAAKVTCSKRSAATAAAAGAIVPAAASSSFLADFGKELQGGLRLEVQDGTANQTVSLACGESLAGTTVGSTWGWPVNQSIVFPPRTCSTNTAPCGGGGVPSLFSRSSSLCHLLSSISADVHSPDDVIAF